MSDGYIIRRGGGKLYAVIAVTYPAGALCTCTNGTRTLTAKGTGGKYLFAIPSTGTWTVAATDGSRTKSESVSITEQYQFADVTLVLEYVIFADGVLDPAVGSASFVAGYSGQSSCTVGDHIVVSCDDYYYTPSETGSAYATYKFSGAVDLTDFSVMRIVGRSGTSWGSVESGSAVIGVGTGASFAASVSVPNAGTAQELSIDISALTGSYNVMLKTEALSYLADGGGYAQWIDYIAFE